jgi:hypothetical protein
MSVWAIFNFSNLIIGSEVLCKLMVIILKPSGMDTRGDNMGGASPTKFI